MAIIFHIVLVEVITRDSCGCLSVAAGDRVRCWFMGDTLLWFSAGDEEQPCIGSAAGVLAAFLLIYVS